MLVANWKVYNSTSDCFIWILVCFFCCSHILYFLHVLLCCLIDEGALLEYTVNQQGFIFRETIDKGVLSEIQSTMSHFWRDNQSTRGALSERQLARGNFWSDNDSTRGTLLERRLTGGHFQRDNRLTREALLERLNNTGTVLLIVLLLLVTHCSRPSHIQFALYLFLSCSSEDWFVWYS